MFEKDLQDQLTKAAELQSRYQHAEDVIADANLLDLEPLVARSWLYLPTDGERVWNHPDWPTREWKIRGPVHINLWIPYEHKVAVRAICLASGHDWRKTYSVNDASYPRKIDFLEEHWSWNAGEDDPDYSDNPYDYDEISIVLYRPVVEGGEVGGCKVVRHFQEPSRIVSSSLVISCEVEK